MIVLVPAYEPDQRLVELLDDLLAAAPGVGVVVVDDGSGPAYRDVFEAARARGATVLTHPANRGKGAALRTGFAHLVRTRPGEDVVCADCDGQHTPADVLSIATQVAATGTTVLGVRTFAAGVPARSRLGNQVTRTLVAVTTGRRLRDAQTGLRGYPGHLLPWLLCVGGDRFEYELRLLLRAAREGLTLTEVPIATVYLDRNTSSHFRPLADSLRVMCPLLAFSASSLAAFALDTAALLALTRVTGTLWTAVLGARVLSSTANFLVNRRWVFAARTPRWRPQAARYWALVCALLVAGYVLLATLTAAGLPLLAAKLIADAVLFVASYEVQRRVVFSRDDPGRTTSTADASRSHETDTALAA